MIEEKRRKPKRQNPKGRSAACGRKPEPKSGAPKGIKLTSMLG
jgi:hypothetical protein